MEDKQQERLEVINKINNILDTEKFSVQNAFIVGVSCVQIANTIGAIEHGEISDENKNTFIEDIKKHRSSLPAPAWHCIELFVGKENIDRVL